jgi:hypothetical protein
MPYGNLVAEWSMLVTTFRGWTLTEIKEMSYRDRKNWLEIANKIRKD